MRSEAIATPIDLHTTLVPPLSTVRSGPVAVGVGQEVESTLRAGALVADRLDRGVAVISVIEPLSIYRLNPASVPIPSNYEADRSLERWAFVEHQMQAAAGNLPDWSVEVFWGGVPRTIARAAHDLRSPCIVMGLGRHRPVDRLLGGETALRTVRHADCPVLAIPKGFASLPSTVVAGTDFSDGSAHALRAAIPLIAPDATLHLVHAWESIGELAPGGASYDQEYRASLARMFAHLVAALDLPRGITLRTESTEGRPADRLLCRASELGADLIVVGRHGRGALERLLVGSVATRMLRGATCAVLVVPEPAPSALLELTEQLGDEARQVPKDEWSSVLDAFTRRFAGRVVSLDATERSDGLHTEERGSVLFGTAFDPAQGQLEIILGEPHGRRRSLTCIIPDPTAVAVLVTPAGDDNGLHVVHGSGETLLRLQPPTSQLAARPASV